MQRPSEPIDLPLIYDCLTRFDPEPLYQAICEITRYIESEYPSQLNGLKGIAIFDTIIEDNYQNNLLGLDGKGVAVSYFQSAFDAEICPSIHLYIYEILGGAIENYSVQGTWAKYKKSRDAVWFIQYGKYFLIWNVIVGIVMHQDDYYDLHLSPEETEDKANALYNAFLADRGIKISNAFYKTICCFRIWKANRRMRKWRKHLESLNPTRKKYLLEKRREYESEQKDG